MSTAAPTSPVRGSAIFIEGAPRSGTTLLQAVLACHPSARIGPQVRPGSASRRNAAMSAIRGTFEHLARARYVEISTGSSSDIPWRRSCGPRPARGTPTALDRLHQGRIRVAASWVLQSTGHRPKRVELLCIGALDGRPMRQLALVPE